MHTSKWDLLKDKLMNHGNFTLTIYPKRNTNHSHTSLNGIQSHLELLVEKFCASSTYAYFKMGLSKR